METGGVAALWVGRRRREGGGGRESRRGPDPSRRPRRARSTQRHNTNPPPNPNQRPNPIQPGWVIGKSFYARQQGIVPDKWRTPRDTNFFMLFQVGGVGFVLWLLCVVLWWRVCGCGGLCVLLCLGLLWCCVSEPAVQVGVVVLDPC